MNGDVGAEVVDAVNAEGEEEEDSFMPAQKTLIAIVNKE